MTAGNAIIGHGNRVDEAVLSAGAAVAGLPVSNLQNRYMSSHWRSGSNDPALTWLRATYTQARAFRLIGLIKCDMTIYARYRLILKQGGVESYNSGLLDVLAPSIPFADRIWESVSFWDGRLPVAGDLNIIHALPALTMADEVRIEIDDSASLSTDGFRAARLFAGDGFQAQYNFSWGASLQQSANAYIERARSGQQQIEEYPGARVYACELNHLSASEALVLQNLIRTGKTGGEILWCPFPEDTARNPHDAFLGRMSETPAITRVHFGNDSAAIKIEEIL
jgi:hypothetical protein